jgi:hypothetical protein
MEKGTPEVVDLAKSNVVTLRGAADYVRHTPKKDQVADPDVIKGSKKSSKAKSREISLFSELLHGVIKSKNRPVR